MPEVLLHRRTAAPTRAVLSRVATAPGTRGEIHSRTEGTRKRDSSVKILQVVDAVLRDELAAHALVKTNEDKSELATIHRVNVHY